MKKAPEGVKVAATDGALVCAERLLAAGILAGNLRAGHQLQLQPQPRLPQAGP